jgi:hypothetical protein
MCRQNRFAGPENKISCQTMPRSENLPALTAKIAAALATRPEVFITHPVELKILNQMTKPELDEYAIEHGWRTVFRIGGRQIEFYTDVTARERKL